MLCFTAHRLTPSRNCSKYRTMQLGLCSRRRGDPTPSRYCTSCIGCQSSSGSHIQVGNSDVQSSEHIHSGLPTPPNRRMCLQSNFTFICFPLLDQMFMKTDFSRRAFRFSAASVWNSLPQIVLTSEHHLSVFKSRLITVQFNQAFTEH